MSLDSRVPMLPYESSSLYHFAMQYWRHKGKFRNAAFIFIAEGDTTTLGP